MPDVNLTVADRRGRVDHAVGEGRMGAGGWVTRASAERASSVLFSQLHEGREGQRKLLKLIENIGQCGICRKFPSD